MKNSMPTESELLGLKQRVIDTMIRVRGESYTLGWLRAAYIAPANAETEMDVLRKMLGELEAECEKVVDNVRTGL